MKSFIAEEANRQRKAVIGAWSLLHGLTMLYIDGLATLETAQTIDSLADKVVTMFMNGLVKREKQD